MKIIGVTGNSGAGKTTFTEYFNTKPSIGVIHVDELTCSVKRKYFSMFLQAKEKNTTENTKRNPKLKSEVKAIFYKNKFMFKILMAIRNRLIKNDLFKKIDEFKKQGKKAIVIDDWAISTQKELLPKLSQVYFLQRPFVKRRKGLRVRDDITEKEAALYDLPYALEFVKKPKDVPVSIINNEGSIEELYESAEEVYKSLGELTFDERYSLRGKINYRDVAVKLGRIKDLDSKEREND